jgi:hypothetical protein
LRAAAADVEALRLTAPAGDNAFERYQQVLALEPSNDDATKGLEVIVVRYVTLANTALSNGELDKARRYLDSASGVLPDDKGIALARTMLTAAAEAPPPVPESSTTPAAPPDPVVAAPRRVAVLPFWGRQSAQSTAEGTDLSVELSEFVHSFLRGRPSLEMIYSYYQPGFDHTAVKEAGDLWSGDAVSKAPRMGMIRELGRALGADAVVVYGYQPTSGAVAEIQVYIVDIGDGRVISRAGGLSELAEMTRESFAEWSGAGQ